MYLIEEPGFRIALKRVRDAMPFDKEQIVIFFVISKS